MTMELTPQITLDMADDFYIITITRAGIFCGETVTDSLKALFYIAELFQWGQYGTRRNFEVEVIKLREAPECLAGFDLAQHLN